MEKKGTSMKKIITRQIGRIALIAASAALLGGCATSGNPKDPIEGFNRAMFGINEGLDQVVIRPVASGYEALVPSPLQTGVSNFFSNIADLMIGVNNLLQGKPGQAASDAGRVLVNTTVGFLGILDVASSMGMEKHEEDVGQTFGRWGMGDGAYIVLPFFGPRTVRDTIGLAFDVYTDPVAHVNHVPTRNALLATRIVSDRAELLKADKIIEEAALDKYSYVRDAYLQRRRSLIHDGNPPKEKDESAEQESDNKIAQADDSAQPAPAQTAMRQ